MCVLSLAVMRMQALHALLFCLGGADVTSMHAKHCISKHASARTHTHRINVFISV